MNDKIKDLKRYELQRQAERRIELEKARDYFKDELRVLIDNFGMEKHPEKIEAVMLAIECIKKEIEAEWPHFSN